MIAGKPTNLRFDVQAMADTEQTLELMKGGMSKKSFFALLDWPYDIREMSVMLMHGINGANRFEKIDKRLSFTESNELLQNHFGIIAETCITGEDFKAAQENFMKEISNAARKGVGFREAVKPQAVAPTV